MSDIGHNAPPPVEVHGMHINDLYDSAKQFLDGEPIASKEMADEVGKLLGMIREAEKGADAQRKVEAKPFDDGKKAVQAAWKPLIDKCALASETCKKALAPWLRKVEEDQRAEAERKRKEAEALARQAQEAARAAHAEDLGQREQAEDLIKQAARADREANRAEKQKANVSGLGRAIGLRSYFRAEIVDRRELLNHYARTRPADLEAWLLEQAQRDVAAGARKLPGVNVIEDRRAA